MSLGYQKKYPGAISWETEKAHIDNFAIQIMNDPDLIGYILIYSGEDSCKGEAEARALRIKRYMMEVRGVPWNKVMWKDAGRYRGRGLQILHLAFPRTAAADAAIRFSYEPPMEGQIIAKCRMQKKHVVSRAANKRLQLTARYHSSQVVCCPSA